MRVAINGFGRIGRCFYRALTERKDSGIEIAAINSTSPPRTLAHLVKYDSTFGSLPLDLGWDAESFTYAGKRTPCLCETDSTKIDWTRFNVDAVLECTGRRLSREDLEAYRSKGAKLVLVSAPSDEVDIILIPGCNLDSYSRKEHKIVSMASCTTNCLAPTLKVLDDNFGIVHGFATTVHSYTSDQRLLDGSHEDLRRARAAGQSLIPTRTGANQTIDKIIPKLKGKISCAAIRAPTSTVSLLDLVVQCQEKLSVGKINGAYERSASHEMTGILAVSKEPLVSVDYKKSPYSSTIDSLSTTVNGDMARVVAWYDNEWAYSMRLIDTLDFIENAEYKPFILSGKT